MRAMIGIALLLPAISLDAAGWHLQEVGPGVWAAIAYPVESGGPLCNAGIIDLGGKALVFDASYSPAHGKALREAAEKLVGAPVAYLVNSHGHGDHTRGNQAFEGVSIVGTAPMADVMKSEWPTDPKKAAESAAKRLVDE